MNKQNNPTQKPGQQDQKETQRQLEQQQKQDQAKRTGFDKDRTPQPGGESNGDQRQVDE